MYKKYLDEDKTSIDEILEFLIRDSEYVDEVLKEMAMYNLLDDAQALRELKADILLAIKK